MRKLFLLLMMAALLAFPSFTSAQSDTTLARVNVQLWPEYDQPSRLVIVDFLVDASQPLPDDLDFRIPQDANLIAVAVQTGDGGFLNTEFSGPAADGDWQTFTMPITEATHYRFEYYQELTFNGSQRLYTYLWDEPYAVTAFNVSVLEPLDVTAFTLEPSDFSIQQVNGLTYYDSDVFPLTGGEQYALTLQYEKTTDTLVRPPQGIQPVAPVDENTPGRISFNNSLPYIIGGLGVVMIVGGVLYYFQTGRASSSASRRRKRSHSETHEEDGADTYCPQCGTRARPGDRFCRTCGARLRTQDE